jgi:hypothetical protein
VSITNSGWDILVKIGSLAGLISFVYLTIKDFIKFGGSLGYILVS